MQLVACNSIIQTNGWCFVFCSLDSLSRTYFRNINREGLSLGEFFSQSNESNLFIGSYKDKFRLFPSMCIYENIHFFKIISFQIVIVFSLISTNSCVCNNKTVTLAVDELSFMLIYDLSSFNKACFCESSITTYRAA